MAGFKQGGIEFKKRAVIGTPTTNDHIIVYGNDSGELILKTTSGEDVIVTESLLNAISGQLQSGIDNISLDYPALSGALDPHYVNVTGDTMTGDLIVNANLNINGESTFSSGDVIIKKLTTGNAYQYDASSDIHMWGNGGSSLGTNFLFYADGTVVLKLQGSSASTVRTNGWDIGETSGNFRLVKTGSFGNIIEVNSDLAGESIFKLSKSVGVEFNTENSDIDFTIYKNTSGNAYKYDAGTDTHSFDDKINIGGSSATVYKLALETTTPNIAEFFRDTGDTLGGGIAINNPNGEPQFRFLDNNRNELWTVGVDVSGSSGEFVIGQGGVEKETVALYIDSSNNIVLNNTLYVDIIDDNGAGTVMIDSNLDINGNTVITGDLTVQGTTTTVNTQQVLVEDNILTLNAGLSAVTANYAGIEIDRNSNPNAQLLWNEVTDTWQIGVSGDLRNVLTTLSGGASPYVAKTGDIMTGDLQINGGRLYMNAGTETDGVINIEVPESNAKGLVFDTDLSNRYSGIVYQNQGTDIWGIEKDTNNDLNIYDWVTDGYPLSFDLDAKKVILNKGTSNTQRYDVEIGQYNGGYTAQATFPAGGTTPIIFNNDLTVQDDLIVNGGNVDVTNGSYTTFDLNGDGSTTITTGLQGNYNLLNLNNNNLSAGTGAIGISFQDNTTDKYYIYYENSDFEIYGADDGVGILRYVLGSGVEFNSYNTDTNFTIKKNTSGDAYVYDAGLDTHTWNGNSTFNNNVTINDDLTGQGTTTTVNTQQVLVEDNILTLNAGLSAVTSNYAGIEIDRNTNPKAQLLWNENTDTWQIGISGSLQTILTQISGADPYVLKTGDTMTGSLNITDTTDSDSSTGSFRTDGGVSVGKQLHSNNGNLSLVNDGGSYRLQFVDQANGIQNSSGQSLQLYSYWATVIRGGRNTASALSVEGNNVGYNTIISNTDGNVNNVVLQVRNHGSQIGNSFEIANSLGQELSWFTKDGDLTVGGTLNVNDTTDATDFNTASVVISGGLAVQKKVLVSQCYIGDTGHETTLNSYNLAIRETNNTDATNFIISRSSYGSLVFGTGTSQGIGIGQADSDGGNIATQIMLGNWGTGRTSRYLELGSKDDRQLNTTKNNGTRADVGITNHADAFASVVCRIQGVYGTQTGDLLQVGYWNGSSRDDRFVVDASGNVTIVGDLTVQGTTTSINTQEVLVEDNVITLNAGVSGMIANEAGIQVQRPSADDARLIWDEVNDYWTAGISGNEARILTENDAIFDKYDLTSGEQFVNITYGTTLTSIPTVNVTLETPLSGSDLYVVGINNITTTGFSVSLSNTVDTIGYKLHWVANGTGGFDASNIEKAKIYITDIQTQSGTATSSTRNNHKIIEFDDTADETAIYNLIMPVVYKGGSIKIFPHFVMVSDISNNVVIETSFERLGNESHDIDSDSFGTANIATIAVPTTSGQVKTDTAIVHASSEIDGIQAGEPFRLKIRRLGSDGSDTANGDLQLISIEIREV